MSTRALASVSIVALAAVALVACDPPPTETPSAAPTVTVTETVTATVTETPPPPAETPDFGFTFFEQAQINSTFDEISDQLNYPVLGIEECPHYASVWNTEGGTTYAFTNASNPNSGVKFFYTQQYFAGLNADWPRNAEGVGLGSTRAQVLAAYPSAVEGSVEDLGAGVINTITVNDPDSSSKYVFGIYPGKSKVALLQWGPNAGTQWSHLCGGF